MLAIEVEYLTGVARAANDRGDGADWPPQPDRLFSALVASWAARGERPEERQALEWLERQAPPVVVASPSEPRTAAKVFTPPNDDTATAITIFPSRRRRQERRFPASVPHRPVVWFGWPAEPDTSVFQSLDALARDTSYLGHSASLVRCRAAIVATLDEAQPVRRVVYPGRLAELERAHPAQRPGPGETVAPAAMIVETVAESVFGSDWIVFADAGGLQPDPVAAPLAAKTLIRTVQAGYAAGGVPDWVSGHAADGTPLSTPHLAAVPLLDAGWQWSQGRMMGLALILPRALETASRRARDPGASVVDAADEQAAQDETGLFQALGKCNAGDGQDLRLDLRLPGGRVWSVLRDASPARQSLKSFRYVESARIWASVTPIALDRHPKASGEMADIIVSACERIGLPRPLRVVTGNHAAVSGAVPAYPHHRNPPWTTWQRSGPLAGRRLTHAVISFAEPVRGPMILGAGRFVGLGLCLAVGDEDGRT